MTMMYGMGMGARLGKAIADRVKKRKLKKGMMKATGQDPEQAKKIKRRVDIAAKRKSAQRKNKNKAIAEAARAGYDAAKEQMKK